MRKILALSVISLISSASFADDFSLYYDAAEGGASNKIESVANMQKITFADGKIVVTKKDGSTTSTPISSVKRLFFSTAEAVSIDAPKQATDTKEIHDLTGRKISAKSISTLPKGIYIIDGKKVIIEK